MWEERAAEEQKPRATRAQLALGEVPAQVQGAIFKATHHGTIGELPEPLRPVADRLQQIDRSIPWLLGTKTVRKWLTEHDFTLPAEFKPFDRGPRGIVATRNFRENHVPMPHELDAEERDAAFASLKRKPGARALTDARSPFFKPRANVDERIFADPDVIRETWTQSFNAAGKAIGGAELRSGLVRIFGQSPTERSEFLKNLGKRLGEGDLSRTPLTIKELVRMAGQEGEAVPRLAVRRAAPAERATSQAILKRRVPRYVREAFESRPSEALTPPQEVLRWLERLGNIGKSTLFWTPFPHQRNITTLGLLANPATLPAALGTFVRMGLGFAKSSTKAKVLGEAMRAGATGLPNVEQTGLTDLLKRLGPLGKASAKWYGGVGQTLWGWDDAVKKALFDRELKHFNGGALRAAAAVRRKMVDYSQTSPFQEAIRVLAPFATWRTSMPAAVLRSVAEHPEYALGLHRATGGAISGRPFDLDGKQYQLSGPMAEMTELTSTPSKYVRGSTSLSSKAIADAFALALGQKEMPFSGKYIESQLPIAGGLLNPFGDSPEEKLFALITGAHPYTPPPRHRYRGYRHRRYRQE